MTKGIVIGCCTKEVSCLVVVPSYTRLLVLLPAFHCSVACDSLSVALIPMADGASCRGCDPDVGVLGCRPKPRDSSDQTSNTLWRSRLRAAVCLSLALLVQSFDVCCAEFLSHRRDRMDQEYYHQVKHTFSIETYADAMVSFIFLITFPQLTSNSN